jgi:hypothetical protein
MGTLLFVTTGSGGGGAQSLQAAYDGGPTITLTAEIPITFQGLTDQDPLFLMAPGEGVDGGALTLVAGRAANGEGGGGTLSLLGGAASETAGNVLLAAGRSDLVGNQSGSVTVGLSGADDGDSDGGFFLDPENGVMYLRTHDIGDSGSGDTVGTLRLHVMDATEEGRLSPFEAGMVHFRSEDGDEGTPRKRGFRACDGGGFALLARGYQVVFEGDGIEEDFTFDHELDTLAPIVQVYVQGESLTLLTTGVTVLCLDSNNIQVSISPASAATYYVTIVGF